jgi:hypothetical protein
MEEEKIPQEAITYVVMLSAMQVVLNCSLELKDTIYDQGNVKVKVREAIHAMSRANSKNKTQMWKAEEMTSADFMMGIQIIGEQLAKGDGAVLANITALTRQGIDLSKYKLVEI